MELHAVKVCHGREYVLALWQQGEVAYEDEVANACADAGQYGVPVVLNKKGNRPNVVSEVEQLVSEIESKL